MDECYFCLVSGEEVRIFDSVGENGLIRICEKCAFDEHIPLIRMATTRQLKEAEKPERRISEGLAKARDPKVLERKRELERKEEEKRLQDLTLKDIVNRNYEKKINKVSTAPRVNLIDNFHWIIMRARRSRQLSHAQLAKEISESEMAIKMAEQGKMPEDDKILVNKLERYLGIRIKKFDDNKQNSNFNFQDKADIKQPVRILDFKKDMLDDLKIADLKNLKDKMAFEKSKELSDVEKEVLKE